MTLWDRENWIHTKSSGKSSKEYSYRGDTPLSFWIAAGGNKPGQLERAIRFICHPGVSLNLPCDHDGTLERALQILAEYWKGFSFDTFLSELDTESLMWDAESWFGETYKRAYFSADATRSYFRYTLGDVSLRVVRDLDPSEFESLTLQDHLTYLKPIIKASYCDPMRAFQALLGA